MASRVFPNGTAYLNDATLSCSMKTLDANGGFRMWLALKVQRVSSEPGSLYDWEAVGRDLHISIGSWTCRLCHARNCRTICALVNFVTKKLLSAEERWTRIDGQSRTLRMRAIWTPSGQSTGYPSVYVVGHHAERPVSLDVIDVDTVLHSISDRFNQFEHDGSWGRRSMVGNAGPDWHLSIYDAVRRTTV